MKTLFQSVVSLALLVSLASTSIAQCTDGNLPLTFQFVTCCVENVTNTVTYTIYNDAEEIVLQSNFNLSGAPANHEIPLCLPTGCYYTTLSYSAGFNTSQHLENFSVIGENTSSFNVFQTSNNIPFSFGFCVTATPVTCEANFEIAVLDDGAIGLNNLSSPTDGYTNLFAWDFGDGTNAQGLAPAHSYLENGVFEVCLFQALYEGDIPICVSDTCHTIEMTTVPDNSGCPTSLNITSGEICGHYVIEHNGQELGTNYWFVDDQLVATSAILEQNYMYAGDHQVCLAHVSPTCESSTTLCTTLSTPDCSNSLCPTAITTESNGCHTYTFHLNNLGNFGNITWNFGDGQTTGGQNHVTHTFDTLGVYMVCATAYGSFCQDGIELCIELHVAPCGGPINSCEGTLYQTMEEDCGHVHFEAGPNPTNATIYWNFGDGITLTTTASTIDHYYTTPGIYTAIALIENSACPNNITLYHVVTIADCFASEVCPDSMYAGSPNDCSVWNFEVGSFSPGESVIWNFGDGVTQTGGHFISHDFFTNGVYEVCCEYISNACPSGVQVCTSITVECALDCTLEIEQIPTACGYAIVQAITNVENPEIHWSFNNSNDWSIGNNLTIAAEDGLLPVCAWYNSPACPTAVETCLNLNIDNCTTCTELPFGFDSFINDGGAPYLIWSFYNPINMEQIETGVAQFSANDPYYDHSICLENGCYLITAYNNSPFTLDAVWPQIGSMATIISTDAIAINGTYGYEILISLNGQCTEDCDAVGMSFVSYPSYGGMAEVGWTLHNSANQLVASGAQNFVAMEVASYYSACLAEDCYTLIFTGNQTFEGNANFSFNHIGVWSEQNVTYGEVDGQYTMTVHFNLNSDCTPESCTLSLTATAIEPGLFEFTASGNPEVYPMVWNFGDGTVLEATWVTMHTYTSPGTYQVCSHIQTDACGIVEACVSVNVELESACNYSIWTGNGSGCGDVIFEIPGGSGLGPIIWNFGNEMVTDNQSIIHHFSAPGTYVVTASGSTNDCPNFEWSVSVVVPECDACTPTAALFTSNVADGSTNCVAATLTNLQTNESQSAYFEFDAGISTHEWNNCLHNGCYALTFDSCLPIQAGTGLGFDLLQNGQSLLANALITYQDNYAITYQFGINSDCGTTDCNAQFDLTLGAEPGEIVINNTSTVSGLAQSSWSFGNGDGTEGNPANYYYMQNGVYEICLTVENNLCSNTTCQSIEVNSTDCIYNGVMVSLSSSYQLPNMSDDLLVLLTIEDNIIAQYQLTVEPFNTYPMAFCVPTGCYNVELISNTPLTALGIFAEVVTNNTVIQEAEILFGAYYGSASFGVNIGCEDYQSELPPAVINVFPNPTNEQLQWKISTDVQIESVRLIDAIGQVVENIPPNERSVQVSDLSNGLYYFQVQTNKGISTHRVEIIH